MTETEEHQTVQDETREAVQSGFDVHQKIKSITLKALTERQLDLDNIKNVVEAVTNGITEGVTAQGGQAKEIFAQAASALDDALAVAAEASKLAIEEAASRVSEYSHHDINDAAQNMEGMESVFINTLEKAVKDGNRMVSDIAADFIGHARHSGTAVGGQVLTALESLKELPHWGKETVVSNTVTTTITLAQIGSGILSGIAESLQHGSHSRK